MLKSSLSNLKFLEILDEHRQSFYGCPQEWYPGEWQRLCGCGPSAASTIIWYLGHFLPPFGIDFSAKSKKNCLSLMTEVWEYVTPTEQGIPELKLFYEAVLAYAKSKGLRLEYNLCELPKDKSRRPEFFEVIDFLEQGLIQDAPIAFLNLCNGKEKNLERWHWVTIASLEEPEDGRDHFVNILDSGLIKSVNLSLWFETTKLGGGFVYFTSPGLA